ncbi:hypothetical protein GCM10011317_18000 [Niveispirillum cyanobacteriorum]|nr:hypothetical protein GCM10011317_18000 [Niveispirillum cyanobacteriorum]
MARLSYYYELEVLSPGFLVPVFIPFFGSNHHLIQVIDSEFRVSGFDIIEISCHGMLPAEGDFEVEVGDLALWAFRDSNGKIHLGARENIISQARYLIDSQNLENDSIAAAELVSFSNIINEYLHIFKLVYNNLLKYSELTASTWLDSMLIGKAIRSDLERYLRSKGFGSSRGAKTKIDKTFSITRDNVTFVYTSIVVTEDDVSWDDWKRVAVIFKLERIITVIIEIPPIPRINVIDNWMIVGVGSIARSIILKSPFNGVMKFDHNFGPFYLSCGHDRDLVNEPLAKYKIRIAIVGSNWKDIKYIDSLFADLKIEDTSGHIINIRPLGYGTPNSDKANPIDILNFSDKIRYVWLVTAHRLRQTGKFAVMLSALHTASRFAKSAANGLVVLNNSIFGQLIYDICAIKGIGIIGATRYIAALEIVDLIRRVLFTMVSEDVYLHSAKKIIVFCPSVISRGTYNVSLGNYNYSVILIETSSKYGGGDLLGYAIDVVTSSRTRRDFLNLCLSIFDFINIHVSSTDEHGFNVIYVEYGVNVVRCLLTHSKEDNSRVFVQKVGNLHEGDLIITNQTVTSRMRKISSIGKFGIIHYSGIERYFNALN